MKRLVTAVTLFATTLAGLRSSNGGDDYSRIYRPSYQYVGQPAYPAPYAPAENERPLLKKLIVGGLLVGAGIAIGRLTAPQPQPYDYGYAPYDPGYSRHSSYYSHDHGHSPHRAGYPTHRAGYGAVPYQAHGTRPGSCRF